MSEIWQGLICSGLLLGVGAGLGACGHEAVGSCAVHGDGGSFEHCIEFTGADYDVSGGTNFCNGARGTFTESQCATANLLGKCTQNKGNSQETVTFYYAGSPETAAQAQSRCYGDWSAQ